MSNWKSSNGDYYVTTHNLSDDGVHYVFRIPPKIEEKISKEITDRLKGVHPEGKNIIVPHKSIFEISNLFYDIHKKHPDEVIPCTIEHIVTDVKYSYVQEIDNSNLTAWNMKYDGTNAGITSYNGVRVNNNKIKSENSIAWTY
jgi:hypothetical protein